MHSHLFQVERTETPSRLIKIRFAKDAPAGELVTGLQAVLEEAFAEHCRFYTLDLPERP